MVTYSHIVSELIGRSAVPLLSPSSGFSHGQFTRHTCANRMFSSQHMAHVFALVSISDFSQLHAHSDAKNAAVLLLFVFFVYKVDKPTFTYVFAFYLS